MRGERAGAAGRRPGGGARALREQRAEALARPISSIARSSASAAPKRSHGASISPRSAHSIAHAIVPPAEMVSSPSSSQRRLASSTASGSDTPHSGPSANTFSYSTRVLLPAGALVDVLAADRARGAAVARDAARLGEVLGGEPRRVGERRGLEVARREGRDRVEREQVGERAELAVLRGRRAERARAQVACRREHRLGVGGRDLGCRPHRDRLQQLRAENRAEAAAAGVSAVVRNRRVLDLALARGADRRDPPSLAETLAQARLGRRRRTGPRGRPRARGAAHRRRRGAPTAARTRPARRSRRGRSACRRSRNGWRRARR